MDFKALLNTVEYDFLRTNPRLGSRIMLLGVSGSHGYGTNRDLEAVGTFVEGIKRRVVTGEIG